MNHSHCSRCHVEAEANGQTLPRPKKWGPNCPRHSDNIKAAQTIFGSLPAQTKGTMHRYSRPGTIGLALMILAIACLLGCALAQDTELKPATVDPVTGVSNTPVIGKELSPAAETTIRATGSLFGPLGEAVAECGLAVVALFMAGLNHRRLSKHLADNPAAIPARPRGPRAPAGAPAEA